MQNINEGGREVGHEDTDTTVNGLPALPEICARLHAQLQAFLDVEPRTDRVRKVQEQTRISLKVIRDALERYSLDELSLSYNGGKDCLVLLILYLAAVHSHFNGTISARNHTQNTSSQRIPQTLPSVFQISLHPFQEVTDFVESSARAYQLDLVEYAKPMKEAFKDYLEHRPQTKAIFVGTRRTDPHGAQLTFFDLTDRGWPSFMRIHPVIDWHYAEIWTFILELEIPYCPLYDLGYTSLGSTTDTHRNPHLRADSGGGEAKYRPAYELEGDDEERLGRD